jgi:hypothetical protein
MCKSNVGTTQHFCLFVNTTREGYCSFQSGEKNDKNGTSVSDAGLVKTERLKSSSTERKNK